MAEVDETLKDRRNAVQAGKRGRGTVGGAEVCLALPVIAEPSGLEHRGQSGSADGPVQIGGRVDGGERGRGKAKAPEEPFFAQSILTDRKGTAVRTHRAMLFQDINRLGGDVLELEGNHVNASGKRGQSGLIAVVGRCGPVRDVTRRGIRPRLEHMATKSQTCGGDRQHTPELATTENPDGAAGFEPFSHPRALPERMRRVSRARYPGASRYLRP